MSLTAQNKNSASMSALARAGQGWQYDDPTLTYDGAVDVDGRAVLYDSIGSSTTLTPLSKSSVTLTGLNKNNA